MLIDNKFDYEALSGDASSGITSVVDFIRKNTDPNSGRQGKLDLVTGYFTIAGLDLLNKELHKDNEYRLVLSELASDDDFMARVIDLLQGDAGIDSALNLSSAAKGAIEFLKRETVKIKAITNAFCHAKSYVFEDINDSAHDYYIMGSSNLTEAELGMRPSSNLKLKTEWEGEAENANYA